MSVSHNRGGQEIGARVAYTKGNEKLLSNTSSNYLPCHCRVRESASASQQAMGTIDLAVPPLRRVTKQTLQALVLKCRSKTTENTKKKSVATNRRFSKARCSTAIPRGPGRTTVAIPRKTHRGATMGGTNSSQTHVLGVHSEPWYSSSS